MHNFFATLYNRENLGDDNTASVVVTNFFRASFSFFRNSTFPSRGPCCFLFGSTRNVYKFAKNLLFCWNDCKVSRGLKERRRFRNPMANSLENECLLNAAKMAIFKRANSAVLNRCTTDVRGSILQHLNTYRSQANTNAVQGAHARHISYSLDGHSFFL